MNGFAAQDYTVRQQLLAELTDGLYADCQRLPRESVLAEKMGISRTQLRDVLASLEREGFIYTLPGKGCYVAPKNVELLREENLKRIEGYLEKAVGLAASCNLTKEDLLEMVRFIMEERE